MIFRNSLFRTMMVLALLLVAGPASVSASPLVIPQAQAARFCRVLINDGEQTSTLAAFATRMMQADDSLSVEQIFAGYILLADNWPAMRVFPHRQGDRVEWYSAADALPASMDAEHQKYIHQLFPRLVAEVKAENWAAADAYVDKLLEYQCQFGGSEASAPVSSTFLVGVAVIFLVVVLVSRFLFVLLHARK